MELKLSRYLSHHAVVFKTKVSHFKVKNTHTKMEMESSKEFPVFFLWTKESFWTGNCSLRDIQPCFVHAESSPQLKAEY